MSSPKRPSITQGSMSDQQNRPLANFHPNVWGDIFLNPSITNIDAATQLQHQELKEKSLPHARPTASTGQSTPSTPTPTECFFWFRHPPWRFPNTMMHCDLTPKHNIDKVRQEKHSKVCFSTTNSQTRMMKKLSLISHKFCLLWSDPMVVVYIQERDGAFTEVFRTEVVLNSLNPKWITKYTVTYQFQIVQTLL
ncbi:hypothetical protein V6N13_117795 [Hibiscus sabdariffa]